MFQAWDTCRQALHSWQRLQTRSLIRTRFILFLWCLQGVMRLAESLPMSQIVGAGTRKRRTSPPESIVSEQLMRLVGNVTSALPTSTLQTVMPEVLTCQIDTCMVHSCCLLFTRATLQLVSWM